MKSRNAVWAVAAFVAGGAFQGGGAWAACDPSGTNQNCVNSEVLTGGLVIYDTDTLTLLNTSTGAIQATDQGIWSTNRANVTNYGSITGGPQGIFLETAGGIADVDNYGLISGMLAIYAGNTILDNYAGGTVTGIFGVYAVNAGAGTAVVYNAGDILGVNPSSDSYGILTDTLNLTNDGTVSGGFMGVGANVAATIVNRGKIMSTGEGALFTDFGVASRGLLDLTNSGAIIGEVGVSVATADGSSMVNSGLIRGTGGIAIDFTGAQIPAYTTLSQNSDLTFLAGSRIDGDILLGDGDEVFFRSGNDIAWLTTVDPSGGYSITGSGSAPYVIDEINGQFATLDPTAYAMADRAFLALSSGIGSVVDGRLDGDGALANGGADNADNGLGAGFWANGFAGLISQGENGPNLGSDFAYGGGLIGFESDFGGGSKAGLFAGGGTATLDVDSGSQSIDSDFFTTGAYGRIQAGQAFVGLSFVGGFGDNDSERLVANNQIEGMFETAEASYDSYFLSPAIRFGYDVATAGGATWTPSASLRFVYADLDGYDETGSAQNLSIDDRTLQDLEGRLALARTQSFAGPSGVVDTELVAGLIGLTRLGDTDVDGALLGQTIAFDVTGDDSAFGGFLGAGLDIALGAAMTLSLDAEASWMTDSLFAANGQATLEIAF